MKKGSINKILNQSFHNDNDRVRCSNEKSLHSSYFHCNNFVYREILTSVEVLLFAGFNVEFASIQLQILYIRAVQKSEFKFHTYCYTRCEY